MNIFVALIMSALSGLLAYAALHINVSRKLPFLAPARGNTDVSMTNFSPLLKALWYVFVIAASFAVTVFIFAKVKSVIGILRLLLSLICLSGAASFDFQEKRIPNAFPLTMAAGAVLLLVSGILLKENAALSRAKESLIVAAVCFLMLTLAAFLSKNGIGAGDIKLLSALALSSGPLAMIGTLFYSVFFCGLIAAILLITQKCSKKEGLPFAPFILFGFAITVIFHSI